MQARPLKIAVIVKSFRLSGGMERYAVEVATRLAQKGHRIDILAREVDPALKRPGIRVVLLPKRRCFSSVLSALTLARDAAAYLADKEYDVIHSHERGYFQDVLTCHCFSFKGSLRQYSFLRRLDQTLLSPRAWLYLYLEARQMRTARLVAVSSAVRNDIADNYERLRRVSVIEPGVDIGKFNPRNVNRRRDQARQELAIFPDELVVLFVGSEFKRKGLDCLIPAVQPEGLRLLAVGRGDKPRHYQRLVEKYGGRNRIHFTGLCDDVLKYYAAADLVVLPSHSEAFGMSILEGMACGLPVVVSPNIGASALVRDGENGFIVAQDRLAEFFSYLPEPQTLKKVGRAAWQTVQAYQWQKVSNQYEQLFYEVAAAKHRQQV